MIVWNMYMYGRIASVVVVLICTSFSLQIKMNAVVVWIPLGIALFTVSWNYTSGGYLCSIPLSFLLLLYIVMDMLCVSESKSDALLTYLQDMIMNLVKLLQRERRTLLLLSAYWSFKIIASNWYPYTEQSNGSPWSLIFFTVVFITLFIIPTVIGVLMIPVAALLQWKWCLSYSTKSKQDVVEVFHIIRNQKKIVFLISVFVIFLFVIDGDITCLIRYTMKGKPCWPVLIPRSKRGRLPYPLKHAWIKTWHRLFLGYTPHHFITFIQMMGMELGEVCRLLPVLIGVYVVSLLFVTHRHSTIRHTLFACVAGVVLGGVTSGSFKILLHRYRPNAYGDPYKWTGPGTAVVNHLAFSKLDLSFPAGHTTVTSAVATCLYISIIQSIDACSIIWKLGLALLLYIFPAAVLVSRVGDCYHWTSDAAFGVCHWHEHFTIVYCVVHLFFNTIGTVRIPGGTTSNKESSSKGAGL